MRAEGPGKAELLPKAGGEGYEESDWGRRMMGWKGEDRAAGDMGAAVQRYLGSEMSCLHGTERSQGGAFWLKDGGTWERVGPGQMMSSLQE